MIKLKNILFEEVIPYKIYCDMDGVICDLFGELVKLEHQTGVPLATFRGGSGGPKVWKVVDQIGTKFWSNMPWTPDGKELWNYIKQFNPIILSSVPYSSPYPETPKISEQGKIQWIKRNLGENVKYIIVKTPEDKDKYVSSEGILIDDLQRNIDGWINHGGKDGVLYTNAQDAINQIKDIMTQIKEGTYIGKMKKKDKEVLDKSKLMYGREIMVNDMMKETTQVGFWNNQQNDYPQYPMPQDMVGKLDKETKRKIIDYLSDRKFFKVAYRGWADCRICGEHLGSSDYSDKKYTWPQGYEHYIQKHNVVPPKDFIKHILKQK